MNYLKTGSQSLVYRMVKDGIIAFFITIVIGGSIGLWLEAVGITNGFAFSLLAVFLLGLMYIIINNFLEYNSLGYNITPNSLQFREGILSVRTITIPFAKITNVSYNQSLSQRIFSVGDVHIDQEDSSYAWNDIDNTTANQVVKEISSKSNVQPISAAKSK